MEAKTDAHSPQRIRYIGDLSFFVITMYEPVLVASQVSTSELLGPAVLWRTPCTWCQLLTFWCCVPWPLGRRFAFYRFIVYRYRIYRLSLSLSNYRNSFSTILSYRYRTAIPTFKIRYPTLECVCATRQRRSRGLLCGAGLARSRGRGGLGAAGVKKLY